MSALDIAIVLQSLTEELQNEAESRLNEAHQQLDQHNHHASNRHAIAGLVCASIAKAVRKTAGAIAAADLNKQEALTGG